MSKDIGKVLLAKTDIIVECWIESIREDEEIESSKNMAYKAVRNSIPVVIKAIATLLSETISSRMQKLKDKSKEWHDKTRKILLVMK